MKLGIGEVIDLTEWIATRDGCNHVLLFEFDIQSGDDCRVVVVNTRRVHRECSLADIDGLIVFVMRRLDRDATARARPENQGA